MLVWVFGFGRRVRCSTLADKRHSVLAWAWAWAWASVQQRMPHAIAQRRTAQCNHMYINTHILTYLRIRIHIWFVYLVYRSPAEFYRLAILNLNWIRARTLPTNCSPDNVRCALFWSV